MSTAAKEASQTNVTNLIVDLGDLDGMAGRALRVDNSEGSRAGGRVCDVVDVVGRVKILSIPAAASQLLLGLLILMRFRQLWGGIHGEDDARSDTARAWRLGEVLGIQLGIHTRGHCVASKVGARVASEAALHIPALAG